MIVSFRNKGLKRPFESGDRSKLQQDMVERIERVLTILHSATSVEEIAAVQNLRLHQLQGNLKGFWSVTVRANWRIVFTMNGDEIGDVDFVDYH